MIKDKNYITIPAWMRTKLNLKGNELIIYAIVYGFCQDEASVYSGSCSYLSDWVGVDKKTVRRLLSQLVKKGLLVKIDKVVNGVKLCDYRVGKMPDIGTKCPQGGDKMSPGGGDKISPGGGDKMPPHITNIDILDIDNKYDKKDDKESVCVPPVGDILGDKRPDGANDLPSPKKTTKPEDYGLVKFDISEIEFGDYERLVNWFEYNHREKSTGKVMRPYCKKMFKQMVNQAKGFANGIWFKAVDCIEAAVNNNNQGFGKAECGFFVKPKTDEDYELEESLARDYRTHPQDMPERIMRYKPMVLDLALDYCNEQLGKLKAWKAEEQEKLNGLEDETLRGYALEKIANYDRVITEYVNQIKWVEDEKKSLKNKG